jgi:hypothetical protein
MMTKEALRTKSPSGRSILILETESISVGTGSLNLECTVNPSEINEDAIPVNAVGIAIFCSDFNL